MAILWKHSFVTDKKTEEKVTPSQVTELKLGLLAPFSGLYLVLDASGWNQAGMLLCWHLIAYSKYIYFFMEYGLDNASRF